MQLPEDEEDDEEVVTVPEPLKVSPSARLHCEPHHRAKHSPHKPASDQRANSEIGSDSEDKLLADGLALCTVDGEPDEIDDVGQSVNDTPEDDGPGGCLMEGDVLVEWDDIVEGGETQSRDEVAADGKQDEDDIDMEDESGSTGDG